MKCILLCVVYSLPVSFHIYDFNAQHGAIKHKVSSLIKDDIGQSDAVHLLQLSLHRHSAAKLHIRQLLPHLLELREHLPLHRDNKFLLKVLPMCIC